MTASGWLAALPTLAVVAAAILFRSTLPALVVGVLVGHALLDGGGLVGGFAESLRRQVATPTGAWVLLVCGLFGGLIELVLRAGGTAAFTAFIASRLRSGRIALVVAWAAGLVIFIDDYLNALLIGHALRPVTDRLRVPRERLAYVIDATAAPVCILVPLSTWAVYVSGLLETSGAAPEGGGMRAYLGLIPWAFYGWVAVLLVPLVALEWIPAWGAMRAADRRVAAGGPTAPPGSVQADDVPLPADGRLTDFLVPVAVLVAATVLAKGDALHGVIWALVVTAIQQSAVRRRLSAAGVAESVCRGVGAMMPTLATILLAFALQDVNDRLGLTRLVIDGVAPLVSSAALPAVAFVALALVTFATGSFWGTYAVALPIVVPLARELDAHLPLTLGAVVSAGAFGSHACFFGDTTVLASQASGCENLAHATSQLPYVLLGAAVTIAAYLVCGAAFAP